MTNNEFFENIYKPYQEQHMASGTCYTRCNILKNRLLEEYGEETPSDISYLTIDEIYNGMEADGLRQNTIFGTYAAFYSYFRMAAEHGESEDNPVNMPGRSERMLREDAEHFTRQFHSLTFSK